MFKYFLKSVIFRRIFLMFFIAGLCIIIVSGYIDYQSRKAYLTKDILKEVTEQLDLAVSFFRQIYSASISSDLKVLSGSPTLNEYLTASKDEVFIIRPDVEKFFLHFTKSNPEKYLSVRFIDTKGFEKIVTEGNRRVKKYYSVDSYPSEKHYQGMRKIHEKLKSAPVGTFYTEGPFFRSGQP